MYAEDMIGDSTIAYLVNIICDDEQQIETREQGVGEGDVFVGILVDVVLIETEELVSWWLNSTVRK